MKKPGIPSVPAKGDDRLRFDSSMKECLESIMGRSTTKIKTLDRDLATTADCVDKLNEIIEYLQ